MDDTDDAVPPALSGYTGYLLARAFGRARAVARRVMPPGHHSGEPALLGLLKERGPLSQRWLADRLGINPTFMVKVIDGLERDGYVRRERNPADRRSYALTITDAGTEALEEFNSRILRGEQALVGPLTPEERTRVTELLGAILPPEAAPPSALTGSVGYFVSINHFRLREQGRQAMRSLGMEPRYFGMLTVLAEIEPCSQQRLAEELGVTGPAIVGAVDELARTGRIVRERNPDDRRQHALRLTAKGRADLAEARAVIDQIHDGLVEHVGRDGLEELNTLLIKIIAGSTVPC